LVDQRKLEGGVIQPNKKKSFLLRVTKAAEKRKKRKEEGVGNSQQEMSLFGKA